MPENTTLAQELLQDLLHKLARSRKSKQAIIAVDAPDQSFQWIGAVGETITGEPVAENTPYFIASIDKLYNATIALMLTESGTLDLGQSISYYLPETITQGLHRVDERDLTAEITLMHLLTHTSGLADWFEDYPKGGSNLSTIVFKEAELGALTNWRVMCVSIYTLFAPIPAVFGHTGSTGCWLFYCPDLDVTLSGSVEDAAAGAVPFGTAPIVLRILSKAGWKRRSS